MGKKNKNKGAGEGGAPNPNSNPQQGGQQQPPRQQQTPRQNPQTSQQQQQQQPRAQQENQQQRQGGNQQGKGKQNQQQNQGGSQQQAQRNPQQQQRPNPPQGQSQQQQNWGNRAPQQQQPSAQPTPQPSWGNPNQPQQPTAAPQQPSFFAQPAMQPQQPQKRPQQRQQQQQQQAPASAAPSRASSVASSVGAPDQQMAAMKLVKPTPSNMRFGTKGRKCILKANYLPINFKKLPDTVYHYDLNFDPDVAKKFFSAAVDAFMNLKFRGIPYAHDGRKNLYTGQALKLSGQKEEAKVTAVLGERSKDYLVKLQFAREIDMRGLKNIIVPNGQNLAFDQKPLLAITALNIIIRKCFKPVVAKGLGVPVGASLYITPQQKMPLSDGYELWLGLFQSVVMGQKSMYLNVDVSHKAFPSQMNLVDLVKNFNRGSIPRDPYDRCFRTLDNHLKMLEVTYDRKTYKFNKVCLPPNEEFFQLETPQGKKKTSIMEYFKSKNIRLTYPQFPCVSIGKIVVPLELCSIAGGQATNKKASPRLTAEIIKYSATTTGEREKKIKNLLSNVNYNEGLRDFGIEINNQNFEQVEGRVIDAPKLQYAGSRPVDVFKGTWRGGDFLETPADEQIKWAIINFDNYAKQKLQNLRGIIGDSARRKKVMLASNPMDVDTLDLFDRNVNRRIEDKFKNLAQNGCKIIFVIIQDQSDNYAKVKQAAELCVGIMTQCIKSRTLERIQGMTMDNILLKVNAKLCGKNHEIVESTFNRNTGIMFVGADVTHAGPDQRDIPSVVGVVSSYDKVGFKYQCSWRLQAKTNKSNQIEEMIQDLENVMVDHLRRYQETNRTLPAKIMYYRDGVSEGQFKEVMNIEMNAMRRAMTRIYGPDANKHAKVTFIVVQKRHHARFFPTQKDFTDGKFNNILPGTVVDKDIVDPYTFQFFLASHAAIQGVTKPTKYCILLDETGFNADDLQAITYDLCHLFTRCNRSVSYPAPTYYAHLVAARGKQYIIGERLNMRKLQDEYDRRQITPQFNKSYPMFFV